MAAITQNTNQSNRMIRFLESLVITNQAGGANQVAANKYIRVPQHAKSAMFLLYLTSAGGTSPSLQLELNVPDISTAAKLAAPDDANVGPLADFAHTAITGTGPYLQQIHFGPGIGAVDSTGAAAADAAYTFSCVLPPVISYRILVDGTTGDEDYTAQLVVVFRES